MLRKATAIFVLIFCFLQVKAQEAPGTVKESAYPEMYIQYVPLAMDLGLGFAGVKSKHNFFDRFVMGSMACISETVLVNVLKYTVKEERPDGTSRNSFPSGHSATAFTGAELTRMEYGYGWGAGAYGLAATTAVLRVAHDRHWWWDCLAGAGIGVLSAHIAGWLMPSVQNLLENWGVYSFFGTSRSPLTENLTVSALADPFSNTYGAVLALRF